MSKAVLSSRDIVKEVAQCLVKVRADPLLLPLFLFARSLGATTAARHDAALIMSPVNSGRIFPATDDNNKKKKKKLHRAAESLKSFQKGTTSKGNILPSFGFSFPAFVILQKHLGEVRPVGSPVTHKPVRRSSASEEAVCLTATVSSKHKQKSHIERLCHLTSCKRWSFRSLDHFQGRTLL